MVDELSMTCGGGDYCNVGNQVGCNSHFINSQLYPFGFPEYHYAQEGCPECGENILTPTPINYDIFCLEDVRLKLYYEYVPYVETLQAQDATQDLREYHEIVDGITLPGSAPADDKYFYIHKKDNQGIDRKVTEALAGIYSPAGSPSSFNIHVRLNGAGQGAGSTAVRTYWKWTLGGKGGLTQSGVVTAREFDLLLPAPTEVRTYPLSLVFTYKYPVEGSRKEKILGTETINLNLHGIYNYSYPLDDSGALPSASLIGQALEYNAGETSPECVVESIINGIWFDPVHMYDSSSVRFRSSTDACEVGIFVYKDYLNERKIALETRGYFINLDCLATSYLAASLLRSIGIPQDLFGFLKHYDALGNSIKFHTMSIRTIGNPDWQFSDFVYHQLNSDLMGLYDADIHVRDPNRPHYGYGIGILGVDELAYRNSVILLDDSSDRVAKNCTDGLPGISIIKF